MRARTIFFLPALIAVLSAPLAAAGPLEDANRGLSLVDSGRYDEGIRLLTGAIDSGKLSPSCKAGAYHARANGWVGKKEYRKAAKDYSLAINLDPGRADFYFNRAVFRFNTGQYRQAVDDLSKTILKRPKDAKAYSYRSRAYKKLGDAKRAAADAARAKKLGGSK